MSVSGAVRVLERARANAGDARIAGQATQNTASQNGSAHLRGAITRTVDLERNRLFTLESIMHGNSLRNNFEQRQARLLEASGYPGPIAAAMVSSEEKSRFVAENAEQRRLMREAGLLPPRNSHSFAERVSMGIQRLVAKIAPGHAAGGPVVSSPDHA